MSAAATTSVLPEVYTDSNDAEVIKFQEHQRTAARPSFAEQARTLAANSSVCFLSFLSTSKDTEGFPDGSTIQFAADQEGRPIFATSLLSPQTKHLLNDGRCSLTLIAADFKDNSDSRMTLTGKIAELPAAELPAAREIFLAKHPNAFWVDFGDFKWFRMDDMKRCRYIAGFGGGHSVSAADYAAAQPDPIAQFSAPVASHMNQDHEQDTMAMVRQYTGLVVSTAKILTLDRLGMLVECSWRENSIKVRLPFVRPAENRKAIKDVIVEMTKEARAAAATKTSS